MTEYFSSHARAILNFAFRSGSSKQGNTLLACVGPNCVAKTRLDARKNPTFPPPNPRKLISRIYRAPFSKGLSAVMTRKSLSGKAEKLALIPYLTPPFPAGVDDAAGSRGVICT